MKHNLKFIAALALFSLIAFTGCGNTSGEKKENAAESHESSEKGEHARDIGDSGEGEEDGTQFAKTDVYDMVKKGTHLVLKFDAETNAFLGTVENVTDKLIERVRVEVHLSNGLEVGPTTPVDLKAGQTVVVKLEASEKAFETWSTHAEIGSSEHSNEGGEGEHSREEGEHR